MKLQRLMPKVARLNTRSHQQVAAVEPPRMAGRKLQERRLRLWTKDPHCAACGILVDYAGETASPFQLDHIVALHKGGRDEDDNCQVLCIPCHEAKTAEDLGRRPVRTK